MGIFAKKKAEQKMRIRTLHFSIAILISITLLGVGILFISNLQSINVGNPQAQTSGLQTGDLRKESERLSLLIDEIGADGAYEESKKEYRLQSLYNQHLFTHIFGALLYEKVGIEGVSTCDEFSTFGCYHGFWREAILNKDGIGHSSLVKICPLGSIACQHGIGHGILAYLGTSRVAEALEICEELSYIDLKSCPYGVFMEHIRPTFPGSTNHILDALSFDPAHPYAPCSRVPAKFLESCYAVLPGWWSIVLEGDDVAIGRLCGNMESRLSRETCFRQIGSYVAGRYPSKQSLEEKSIVHDSNSQKALATCQQMPSQNGVHFCKVGLQESLLQHLSK